MLQETLIEFFEHDLLKLNEEISLYPTDELLWQTVPGIANSAGNLALHLVGNLNHFIGATLAHNGYVRDRDSEFSLKGLSRQELIKEVDKVLVVVLAALTHLKETDFNKEYPLEKHGKRVTTGNMLLHLFGHLSYHLGQINYHRRMPASA